MIKTISAINQHVPSYKRCQAIIAIAHERGFKHNDGAARRFDAPANKQRQCKRLATVGSLCRQHARYKFLRSGA